MAKSSIHIEAGNIGFFSHNSREKKTENAIFSDEENYCSCTNREAIKFYKSELEKRTNAYLKNHPNRKKLHAKTITHLSAIVNFNKEHTETDIKKVCDYLEETFDTKIIQFSLHRDEGHIEDDGTEVKNYHAHIEFMGIDSEGNSVRRKLTKKSLIALQDKTAELLNMERGRNFNKEFKEFKQGIKEEMPTKAKRLNTYEYKAHAKKLAEVQKLAKQKDLKEEIKELKTELQANKATRADYAELEQIHRELKEQLKQKDLTIETMQIDLMKFKHKFLEEQKENEELIESHKFKEVEIYQLESSNKSLQEQNKDLEITETYLKNEFPDFEKTQGKTLLRRCFKFLADKIDSLKERILGLEKENRELKEENKYLNQQIIDSELGNIQEENDLGADKLEELKDKYSKHHNLDTSFEEEETEDNSHSNNHRMR